MSEYAKDSSDGFSTTCRCESSISRACSQSPSGPAGGNGRMTLVEFRPASLSEEGEGEPVGVTEAKDATDS
jgi:hypothetical protein